MNFGLVFGIETGIDTKLFEGMLDFDKDGFVFFGRNEMKGALVTELGGVVEFAVGVSTGAAKASHNFGRLSVFKTIAHINEGNFGFGGLL